MQPTTLRTPRRASALLLACSLACLACSDDDTRPPDAAPRVEAGVDASTREAGPDMGTLADLFRSDAASCSELSATDCFSNLDCPAEQRCQSTDGAGVVVCCLPGPRGPKTAGQSCASEAECASAVCIAKGSGPSLCSKDCQREADCPAGMKDCKTIAFSGSPQKWCFPE